MSRNQNEQAGEMLIQEVEEDLRREFYLRLWRSYGKYAIGAAVAVVLAVAGYQGYKSWKEETRQEEATRFTAAAQLAEKGDFEGAGAAYDALAKEASDGYRIAARMAEAQMLQAQKDSAGALKIYETMASDQKIATLYRGLAQLKQAMILLETDPLAAEKTVSPLLGAENPWRNAARELTALAALAQNDKARAKDLYGQITSDTTASLGIRRRAGEMIAALGEDEDAGIEGQP